MKKNGQRARRRRERLPEARRRHVLLLLPERRPGHRYNRESRLPPQPRCNARRHRPHRPRASGLKSFIRRHPLPRHRPSRREHRPRRARHRPHNPASEPLRAWRYRHRPERGGHQGLPQRHRRRPHLRRRRTSGPRQPIILLPMPRPPRSRTPFSRQMLRADRPAGRPKRPALPPACRLPVGHRLR